MFKQIKIEELRQEIQKGIKSGKSIPFDPEAIKAEGKRRMTQGQNLKQR